jgi:thioesterase domain-containing protein/acyl carrier protein
MNNDGIAKVGFSAPSVQGQADAIISALAMSEVDPETISYVETHGTATFLGDPIEISALTQAFGLQTQKKEFCAIGSVKGNIGHLFESAGIAGLIKTALSLHHEKIPPSIHFETPNPNIDFAQSPFFVNTALREWKRDVSPRRAGVSSFGFGGTNAHVILEEAPLVEAGEIAQKEYLLQLSAKTASALRTQSKNLAHYLKEHPDVSLADVAYTLRVGRRSFAQRRVLSCKNREDAIQQLLKESGDATVGAPQEHLGRRISLPTYPFEKKCFWIDAPRETGVLADVSNKKADSLKEIELALLAIWKDFLGVESLKLDDDFFKLGGDSFLATQVVAKVQEQLAVSLRMQALIESPTVSQLAREIFNKLQAISKDAALPAILVKIRAGGSKAPLFFVHPIGGNVFCYKSLAECLKYDGPIFGIQAPLFAGIDAASLTSMEEIAAYYVKAIRSVQPKGAYHLLGASFGGAVAYEMARQLKEEGLPVALLAMIDIGNPEALFEKAESDLEMLALLIELFEAKAVALESLKVLSPEDQIKRLMQSMGLEEMSLSLQKQVFEQVKGSWRALMHYHPKPYAGKILFFQAQERFFRHKEMSLGEGWRNLAKGGIAIHEVAGNHLNMIMLPGVADLQSALDSYLQMEALS